MPPAGMIRVNKNVYPSPLAAAVYNLFRLLHLDVDDFCSANIKCKHNM